MKLIVRLIVLLLLSIAAEAQNATPASQAAKRFLHGANIANYLEANPNWRVPHSAEDLREIRAQGFDHIRLPVAWSIYAGPAPDFKLSDDIFALADEMITNATALGLNVIVNFHNFDEMNTNPSGSETEFLAVWKQVAAHYASQPDNVAFELCNEPNDKATTAMMNPIYADAIREIRQTNPHRTLVVGPGEWNSPDELTNLQLPVEDDNIIVTVHCYEPFFFTHQGATWTDPSVRHVTGIEFPGPPIVPYRVQPGVDVPKWTLDKIHRYNTLPSDENPSSAHAFMVKIQEAQDWQKKNGRPIYFGEYGAYMKADQRSRARYYAAMRQALDAAGFGWAIWDWKSGFNYWDPKTHQPLAGMREALFPN
jgi:endoglucanase